MDVGKNYNYICKSHYRPSILHATKKGTSSKMQIIAIAFDANEARKTLYKISCATSETWEHCEGTHINHFYNCQ